MSLEGDDHVKKLCFLCLPLFSFFLSGCLSSTPFQSARVVEPGQQEASISLQKSVDGPVVYDQTRCIGCRYCIMACPFDVPKYEWDQPIPIVGKCVLCAERVGAGLETFPGEFGERSARPCR